MHKLFLKLAIPNSSYRVSKIASFVCLHSVICSVLLVSLQDPQCNFIQHFERDQRQAFRRMVIDMVCTLTLNSCAQGLTVHVLCVGVGY